MNKRNRDLNTDSWQDPWNTEFYETGSTRPPKNRRGMFALVLVGGIVLGSILTAFGGINLQLLREWGKTDKDHTLPVSLYTGETAFQKRQHIKVAGQTARQITLAQKDIEYHLFNQFRHPFLR